MDSKIQSLLNDIATMNKEARARKEAKITKYGKSVTLSDSEAYECERKRWKKEAINQNIMLKYYKDFCNE